MNAKIIYIKLLFFVDCHIDMVRKLKAFSDFVLLVT